MANETSPSSPSSRPESSGGEAARSAPLRYAFTIFVSSFLLFQIQPMIARVILPWFGGTPTVWSTCMLFFQTVLLAGYTLAHLIYSKLDPRKQCYVFVSLLVIALLTLGIAPDLSWKPVTVDRPATQILALLAVHVGLPYLILSTVSPLLQGWFTITSPGVSPYRLYALSNVGSLLALVSYPFIIEPSLALNVQMQVWSYGFLLFVLLSAYCAVRLAMASGAPIAREHGKPLVETGPVPRLSDRALWFGLSTCSSLLLLGVTNHLCHDVMVVPFLWVWPLTIYLITFILCFESSRWYNRKGYFAFVIVAILAACDRSLGGQDATIIMAFLTFSALLFAGCMVCHGELVILRPGPKYLTEFYLFISLGGAVGGILVGLLAPQMFSSYLEMPLALMLLITLMSIILMTDEDYELYAFASRGTLAAVLIAYLVISTKLVGQIKADDQDSIHQTRNFYGVLRVIESESNNPEKHRYMLQHGNIIHGLQFRKVERRREPTAYYGPGSGIALTLNLLKPPGQRRIAVLGLGVGTVAAFGAAGDYIRFYEINPDVIDYARRHFTYISDTPAQTDLILGDARLSLESENPNNFDIMLIDTFSGDAIPVHLITKEAIQLYLRHLNQDGVLVINISTQHFDMAPLISTIAESFGLQHRIIRSTADLPNHIYPTIFALLSRNSAFLERPEITAAAAARPATGPASGRKVQLWTDDYSNVFELLRRNIL